MSAPTTAPFAARLLHWYDQHGRHDLPWQHPRTPYRVWVAEVMLQQTQVRTVIPYYERFLARFPSLPALAEAAQDEVLALWSGLGYYSRARNLHRAAQLCVAAHGGELPVEVEALAALPGIGRSTAAAILAQAHGQRLAILDGNVRRVLARHQAIEGAPDDPQTLRRLWALSEALLPADRLADYTQAIMDLGASLCARSRPQCARCPLAADCVALATDRVAELPQRKTRRVRPLRHTLMLYLQDADGRVLLQRRPSRGIWGGLWSLPEAESLAQAQAWGAVEPAPVLALTHDFTHFSLQIALHPVRPGELPPADAESRWYSLPEAQALGLPQPVRRILSELQPLTTQQGRLWPE